MKGRHTNKNINSWYSSKEPNCIKTCGSCAHTWIFATVRALFWGSTINVEMHVLSNWNQFLIKNAEAMTCKSEVEASLSS